MLHLFRGLRKKQLGTLTIRGIVRTLSACLSGAVDEEYLDSNPALNLRKHLRQSDHEKHGPDPLSVDDARQLVDTVRAQFPRWTAFILCGLRAGLRLSELIGLDWTDLDERAATLTIKRAFVRGQLVTPKNHQSRVVGVSPQLLRALLVYRRALRAFALRKGAEGGDDHVPSRGRCRALGRLQRAKGLHAQLHRRRCGPTRHTISATPTRVSCSRRMCRSCTSASNSVTAAPRHAQALREVVAQTERAVRARARLGVNWASNFTG